MNAKPNGPEGAEVASARQLEAENNGLRQRIRQLEEERDDYRRIAYAWAREEFARRGLPFTEEELERRVREEDGVPLEAFLAELQERAEGP
jgi:hypothetical protein